jgi:ABC-type Mn2+/Zn2+ transport system permease subunit
MFEFLAYGFMQRALLAGLLIAVVCAVVSGVRLWWELSF